MTDYEAQLEDYNSRCEASLDELFKLASKTNISEFAFSLIPEFRGAQTHGWNTSEECRNAKDEMLEFIQTPDACPERIRIRIALSLYSNVCEASGFYEIPKNMLRVSSGERYNLYPFQDLVKKHNETGQLICPNANAIFKNLVGHATDLGLENLSAVLAETVDYEIRNAYAHADYVIWDDGLRLRKRNGGTIRIVEWNEFTYIVNKAMTFMDCIEHATHNAFMTFSPSRVVRGDMGTGRDHNITIEYNDKTGSFKISG